MLWHAHDSTSYAHKHPARVISKRVADAGTIVEDGTNLDRLHLERCLCASADPVWALGARRRQSGVAAEDSNCFGLVQLLVNGKG